MVKSSPSFGDSSGVGKHSDSSLDFSQVTAWDSGGWLVVDTDLETSWAPVDELDGSLGLDGGNGNIDIWIVSAEVISIAIACEIKGLVHALFSI